MPLSKQLLLRLAPQKNKVFDNFLASNNAIAVAHLARLCHSAATPYQQIYLWGVGGSGKSHLLQAACSALAQRNKHSIYLPLARLASEAAALLDGLEVVDGVCIDDMDLVATTHRALERALFRLINAMRSNGGCLIMAGRSNPRFLPLKLPDLHSRLLWGSVYQLRALADADKATALALHAKLNNCEVPAAVLGYLLKRYPRDMDTLSSVIQRINHASFQHKRRITLPFVKQILEDFN